MTVLVLPTALILGLLVSAPGPEPMPNPSDLAAILIFLLAPWSIGRFVRDRAAESSAAQERADILEREHAALIAAAAAEERVRLARELHDVVTHSISVVCVQTQAVRHRLGPEHEAEARDLLSVETTAREAMTELRRLFGVLRGDSPAPLAPPPGLGHLERLVASISATGVEVRVTSVRGNGRVGIQERAELYGGAVRVGASPMGGVRVAAHFPAGAC
jgi:signal transduction histidine kinase